MTKKDNKLLSEAYSSIIEAPDPHEDPNYMSDDQLRHEPDMDELKDIQGRAIEIGHIVQLGMSDRQYVVVGFGGGGVEIAELGPAQGYDPDELEIVGDLES